MNNDSYALPDEYLYLQSQNMSYADLGYDTSLTKRKQLVQAGFLSPYEMAAVMEPGTVFGNQVRDIAGDRIVTNTLDAQKIRTSTLDAAVDVGNPSAGYIRLDGPNKRIVGNDGTTTTLVIQV